jgi:chromosome segregation ATPase
VVTNERANALKSAEEEKRNELTTEIEMLGSRLTEAKEALDKESSDKKQVNTELNETKKLLSAAISNSKELASQLNTFQQQRASEIENYTTYINTLEKNLADNKQEILSLQNKKKQASKETQQRQEQAAQALTKAISELVQSEERQVLLQEKLNVSESRLSDLKSSVKEVETKTKLLDATKLSLIKKILSAEMEAKILVEMAIGAQKLEVSKTSRELENRAAIIADLTATEALHKEQLLLTLHEMEKLKEDYQLAKDKIKSLSHKLLEKRIAIDSNNKTGPPSNMVALNLTEHEVETITYEISKCLRIEPNIIGNGSFVEILMDFKKDGMVKRESIALVDTDISNLLRQNAAFQAIKRATLSCENEGYSLPAEKYHQLQSIKLKFGLDIN